MDIKLFNKIHREKLHVKCTDCRNLRDHPTNCYDMHICDGVNGGMVPNDIIDKPMKCLLFQATDEYVERLYYSRL